MVIDVAFNSGGPRGNDRPRLVLDTTSTKQAKRSQHPQHYLKKYVFSFIKFQNANPSMGVPSQRHTRRFWMIFSFGDKTCFGQWLIEPWLWHSITKQSYISLWNKWFVKALVGVVVSWPAATANGLYIASTINFMRSPGNWPDGMDVCDVISPHLFHSWNGDTNLTSKVGK